MKVLVCLSLVVLAVNGFPSIEDVETEWIKFKQTHLRTYRNIAEDKTRKTIFVKNYHKIVEHNELYQKGEKTYYLNINKYADWSKEEIKQLRGYKKSKSPADIKIEKFTVDDSMVVPDEFDWRKKGAVTEIKDQGPCGSCWSFSSTGALEGQYFLKTGNLMSISEQNLVDCSHETGNAGCNGGDMKGAFTYVFTNDGIDSEESYPYEAKNEPCRYKVEANVTSLEGYVTIEPGSESDLKAAVAVVGPIAVAIDASQDDFSFYAGGVYYNKNCNDGSIDPENTLDHAVLAVGYGIENGVEYWLVKNSWGSEWGDEGYIKMIRNKQDNCGIAADAVYPTLYQK